MKVAILSPAAAKQEEKSKPAHHKIRYIAGGILLVVVIVVGAVLLDQPPPQARRRLLSDRRAARRLAAPCGPTRERASAPRARPRARLRAAVEACEIAVRLQPRARGDEIVGEREGRLLVRVTAPPVEGRANEALCRLIARRARVGRRSVSVVRAERGRARSACGSRASASPSCDRALGLEPPPEAAPHATRSGSGAPTGARAASGRGGGAGSRRGSRGGRARVQVSGDARERADGDEEQQRAGVLGERAHHPGGEAAGERRAERRIRPGYAEQAAGARSAAASTHGDGGGECDPHPRRVELAPRRRVAAHDEVAQVPPRVRVQHAAAEVPGAVGRREVDRGEQRERSGRRLRARSASAPARSASATISAAASPKPAPTRTTEPTPAPTRAAPSTAASTPPARCERRRARDAPARSDGAPPRRRRARAPPAPT